MELASVLLENPLAIVAVALVTTGAIYVLFFQGTAGKPLDKKKFQKYKLIKKTKLTHNTRRFRFACESPYLPTGAHLGLKVPNPPNGVEDVERSYTPVLSSKEEGWFDLVIKIYPDGNLTPRLDALNIGDYILARGPKGILRMPESGLMKQTIGKRVTEARFKQINLICGGTGVTPILQTTKKILEDGDSSIKVAIINGNISSDDMLCYDILEERKMEAAKKGMEVSVYYTLDKAPDGWEGGVGYVTPKMMSENLFPPGEDTITCLCGPPPMVRGCKRSLESLGHKKERVFGF